MEKKELKDVELEGVNGGDFGEGSNETQCPSCKYYNSDRSKFSPEPFDEGCSKKNHYTCPKCGYKWDA